MGWFVGAWGGGDVGGGNFLGVVYATVVPAAIFGARFGLATEPDAQKRRRIDQRSRAWIFVTPALGVHRHRSAGPADPHDLPLVPQPQRLASPSGGTTTTTIFHNKNSVNFDNWENIFTSRLFYLALALVGLGVLVGVDRRAADEAAVRARSQLARSDPRRVLRPVVRHPRVDPGHDLQQHLVGDRGRHAGDGVRPRRRRARRPGEGRERRQVVDLPPDGDLVHRRRDHLALHVPGPRSLAGADRAC